MATDSKLRFSEMKNLDIPPFIYSKIDTSNNEIQLKRSCLFKIDILYCFNKFLFKQYWNKIDNELAINRAVNIDSFVLEKNNTNVNPRPTNIIF